MGDTTRPTISLATPPLKGCEHPRVSEPAFDGPASVGLAPDEVRKRWPRVEEECPDCGNTILRYADFRHFIAGDW